MYMSYTSVYEQVEELKDSGDLDKALELVNQLLVKNPTDKEALFQVADIEYRRGEIMRAEKPIDFLLEGTNKDAMSYYIKWVLEMEKTHRNKAKVFFKKALQLINEENPEIMRCYGLCEYWSGNREWGINYLQRAYESNKLDAEILLNLIEVSILEEEWKQAKEYIKEYRKNKSKIQFFDRTAAYYDEKVDLFDQYLWNHLE